MPLIGVRARTIPLLGKEVRRISGLSMMLSYIRFFKLQWVSCQRVGCVGRLGATVWFSTIIIFLFAGLPVSAAEMIIDEYKGGLSPKWEEKSFDGKTEYEVIREGSETCLKATSNASASALYYKIRYDAKEYPVLKWRWKVNGIISKGNALQKKGDDYAARVYVVFPSPAFWRTKTLIYIWANRLPRGKAVPNPYAQNAVMIAVESGPERTGQWVEERRNVLSDYRKHFGQDPPKVGAVAIMTDTDNTGEKAVAWYGPIRVLSDGGE